MEMHPQWSRVFATEDPMATTARLLRAGFKGDGLSVIAQKRPEELEALVAEGLVGQEEERLDPASAVRSLVRHAQGLGPLASALFWLAPVAKEHGGVGIASLRSFLRPMPGWVAEAARRPGDVVKSPRTGRQYVVLRIDWDEEGYGNDSLLAVDASLISKEEVLGLEALDCLQSEDRKERLGVFWSLSQLAAVPDWLKEKLLEAARRAFSAEPELLQKELFQKLEKTLSSQPE